MNLSAFALLAAALTGATLGGAYLGLLWLSVRCLAQEHRGVTLFVLLALARAALVLGALAAAAAFGMPATAFIAALLGFVAVRLAATRLSGRKAAERAPWT